jgi:hypothetical protein
MAPNRAYEVQQHHEGEKRHEGYQANGRDRKGDKTRDPSAKVEEALDQQIEHGWKYSAPIVLVNNGVK